MTPVRRIDPDRISIDGRGGQTDITAALELTLMRLKPYMQALQQHPERAEHPLPLVLLFSDGEHNIGTGPQSVAEEIKGLNLDGEPVVIAVAGVSVGKEHPDERTLREIASPECYVHIMKKGGLFQTTLTLAWADWDHFRVAMLGDGGALWRGCHGPHDARQANDRILAACNLESQQVRALGPADRCVREFDCSREEELNGPFLCAVDRRHRTRTGHEPARVVGRTGRPASRSARRTPPGSSSNGRFKSVPRISTIT